MSTKVLIADDDKSMRTLIVHTLGTIGVSETVEAAHGSEALTLLDHREFDLIVLDWYMPKMNGLDVIKIIRAKGSRVPIIMVTGDAQKDHVAEAIQAGASEYLLKPFDQDMLREKLEKFCQHTEVHEDPTIYRARNVMNTNVITIQADATVGDAIGSLLEHSISGLPVVDDQRQLLGIITEFQLVKAIYRPEIKEQEVCDLMTKDVLVVKEETILSDVADMMEEHRIRRIPVVRNGEVVGIIARRDMLRYMTENEEALAEFLGTVKSSGNNRRLAVLEA